MKIGDKQSIIRRLMHETLHKFHPKCSIDHQEHPISCKVNLKSPLPEMYKNHRANRWGIGLMVGGKWGILPLKGLQSGEMFLSSPILWECTKT